MRKRGFARRTAEQLDTLVAAQAAAGQFDRTIDTAKAAAKLAAEASKEQLLEQIRMRMQFYKRREAYRAAAWQEILDSYLNGITKNSAFFFDTNTTAGVELQCMSDDLSLSESEAAIRINCVGRQGDDYCANTK